jgi:catechol 2,3-dioxygenase-like lactoylglutathione lyase family enzyme
MAHRKGGFVSTPPDRRQNKPETLRLRSIEPSFTVSDLERSLRFYTDVLGFVEGERFTDDRGVLRGVMLKAGTCQLGLSQDDWAKGRDRQRGVAVRIWCTTAQDIDALAKRITAGGGTLKDGPKDESWGGRSLSVDDPDGFHLTIYREA